jgi:acetoin:2,6-dichlorophenolindophenol oxidoreductase subunit alpha
LIYEEMNMAELWKLPVIYVCENNFYNEYTHNRETTAGDFVARATAFGIQGEQVDGQDVRTVYATAARLVERARRGQGPAFLLCNTYRFHGHHVGDIDRTYYRSKAEEQEWKTERDPLRHLADWLKSDGRIEQGVFDQIHAHVQAEIDAGVQFALDAPFPDVSEVDEDVYA